MPGLVLVIQHKCPHKIGPELRRLRVKRMCVKLLLMPPSRVAAQATRADDKSHCSARRWNTGKRSFWTPLVIHDVIDMSVHKSLRRVRLLSINSASDDDTSPVAMRIFTVKGRQRDRRRLPTQPFDSVVCKMCCGAGGTGHFGTFRHPEDLCGGERGIAASHQHTLTIQHSASSRTSLTEHLGVEERPAICFWVIEFHRGQRRDAVTPAKGQETAITECDDSGTGARHVELRRMGPLTTGEIVHFAAPHRLFEVLMWKIILRKEAATDHIDTAPQHRAAVTPSTKEERWKGFPPLRLGVEDFALAEGPFHVTAFVVAAGDEQLPVRQRCTCTTRASTQHTRARHPLTVPSIEHLNRGQRSFLPVAAAQCIQLTRHRVAETKVRSDHGAVQ
mmetsp:Transcript_56492/g.151099  ORF Transcript_56492/g.151099 Transcript_56492/m.151099 type:complete len:390 (+) Transcript_56492:149-1318(+)